MYKKVAIFFLVTCMCFLVCSCSPEQESLYIDKKLREDFTEIVDIKNISFGVPSKLLEKTYSKIEVVNPALFGLDETVADSAIIKEVEPNSYFLMCFCKEIYLVGKVDDFPTISSTVTTKDLKTKILCLPDDCVSFVGNISFTASELGVSKLIVPINVVLDRSDIVRGISRQTYMYRGYYAVIQKSSGETYVMLSLNCGNSYGNTKYAAKTLKFTD